MKNIKMFFSVLLGLFLIIVPKLVLACDMDSFCSYSIPEHGREIIWLNNIQKGQKYNCNFSVSGLYGSGELKVADMTPDTPTLIYSLTGQGDDISSYTLLLNAVHLDKDFGTIVFTIYDSDDYYDRGMHLVNIICKKQAG